jgi:hypothetical protein
MEYEQVKSVVNGLNLKAFETHDSVNALRLTQAALNAANAYATLAAIRKG